MDGLYNFTNTLLNMCKQYKDKVDSDGSIKKGIISGTNVLVEGRYLPFIPAVDINTYNGKIVYVQITSDGFRAILVGD